MTLDRRLLERAYVEKMADVVVDHGSVAGRDESASAEKFGEAIEIELVGPGRVRRELPDRLTVANEFGRRASKLHVRATSKNEPGGGRYPTQGGCATGVLHIWLIGRGRSSSRRTYASARLPVAVTDQSVPAPCANCTNR